MTIPFQLNENFTSIKKTIQPFVAPRTDETPV